ncbi:MAG: 1,4-alpha-glucan branching protein GlgB [Bacteroidota bacterium]
MAYSRFTDYDIYLFRSGKHYNLYDKFGSHLTEEGVYFAVWAPFAKQVSVIGGFNGWDEGKNPLVIRQDGSGIWEGVISEAKRGDLYRYRLIDAEGYERTKSDPFAFFSETPPQSASIVWDTDFKWKDKEWIEQRDQKSSLKQPMSVYEVHLGSWKRHVESGDSLSYLEMAEDLVRYVSEMGFTHVEFLPVMEHPFFGSWGYQVSQYFAPTSRYGTPQELMTLINAFHSAGIGVLLDWVPSHFPKDEFSLRKFDGTHLYEHADPRQGYHTDWDSLIFNYGRPEVRSFLISSALFWLDKYHADGIRVDAVASMLYLDYSRDEGQWIPNRFGGNENLEAIEFLKDLNTEIFRRFPNAHSIAEESTAWPRVSHPIYADGLGFSQKWMMGWMHDSLEYFKTDPLFRKSRHNLLTFGITYAFSENFLLPFSHDEVVHGKASLLGKMPGTPAEKLANLKLLLGYFYTHPGTNLLFMGAEIGQMHEWNHDAQLPWELLKKKEHSGLQAYVKALNELIKSEPALHEENFSNDGFEWVEVDNHQESVLIYWRKPSEESTASPLLIALNFTPIARKNYQIALTKESIFKEILNTEDTRFGCTGQINKSVLKAKKVESGTKPAYYLIIDLPPLGLSILKPTPKKAKSKPKNKKKRKTTTSTSTK